MADETGIDIRSKHGADDIVTALRRAYDDRTVPVGRMEQLLDEAADEIEQLRNRLATAAEMIRIKDVLINKQIARIAYLEGVRG